MSDQPTPSSPTPSRLRDLPIAQGASLGPADYGILKRPDRPFIVSFLGWVCAGIGYLAFFLKGAQLPMLFGMDMGFINPDFHPIKLSRYEFLGAVSIIFAEMLLALMAIAGGLGSLKMRQWGRRMLLYYAMTGVVITLLKAGYQMTTFDHQIDYRISTTTEFVDRDAMANREFFYLVTTSLMGLIWPALVIGIMTRKHVRRAFESASRSRRSEQAIATLSGDEGGGEPPAPAGDEWRST